MYKDLMEKIQKTEKMEKGSRQSKMPFNPQADVSTEERSATEDWVRQGGNEEKYGEQDRESIPEMNPNAKRRGINKFMKQTQSKAHPETGEMMHLMHRGMGSEELDSIDSTGATNVNSSWSPSFNSAKLFALKYGDGRSNLKSAWIPESQIHHIPESIGADKNVEQRMSNDINEGKRKKYEDYKNKKKEVFDKEHWPESRETMLEDMIGEKHGYEQIFDSKTSEWIDNPEHIPPTDEEMESYIYDIDEEYEYSLDGYIENEAYNNNDFAMMEEPDRADVNYDPNKKKKIGEVSSFFKENEVIVKPHDLILDDATRLHDMYEDNESYKDEDFFDEDLNESDPSFYTPNEKINARAARAAKAVESANNGELKMTVSDNLGLTPTTHADQLTAVDRSLGAEEYNRQIDEIYSKMPMKASENMFSKEEAKRAIQYFLLEKAQEYDYTPEEIQKGFKQGVKTGLSVLGLIHGAHYMGTDGLDQKAPQAQERSAERSPAVAAPAVEETYEGTQYDTSPESFKGKNISNFLKAISMNESSGGKNLKHKQMEAGIHSGDSAVGQYGLMPNTIKETVGRMGKGHPLYRRYRNMDNSEINSHMAQNPDHEHEIANHMANRLHDKHGGNESRMAYAWNQGSNLNDNHFKTTHADYKDHDYVQKYNANRKDISINPNISRQPSDFSQN